MKKRLLIILSVATALTLASCSTEVKEDTSSTEPQTTEESTHEEVAETPKEVQTEVIKLEEVEGSFVTTELNLKAGQPYSFEVTNTDIDKEVAFVLAPVPAEGATTEEIMATAIPTAMLTKYVNNGETASSKEATTLEAGEYIYFCPLNGTPHHKIIVE